MKNNQSKKGFTLIELLLAIGIFMGFMLVVTNVYIEIVRAQRAANQTRLIYSELRQFTDYLNTEMREGGIDYFCYNPPIAESLDFYNLALTRCTDAALLTASSNDNLRTISRDGLQASIIKFIPPASAEASGKVCVLRYKNVEDAWQQEEGFLGSSSAECGGDFKEFAFNTLNVKNLKMEIFPKKDPKTAGADLANNQQPMIRLTLNVASKDDLENEIEYQSLIVARN
ncbi:type II secretion system protein [Candidatus Peregrinibacteria bacterium]|nr:type II secretion system protein [Candidatus Peregrinibacteria bacterium]